MVLRPCMVALWVLQVAYAVRNFASYANSAFYFCGQCDELQLPFRMRHFNHLNCIRHLQTVCFCLRLWSHHLPGSHSHTCISAALQGESYTYYTVLLYDIFQTVLSDQTCCCLPTEGTFIAMQM